ncbi:hypothetical protein HOT31_gp094 [Microbacterium phage Hendrix]|uniref:Uncharacterized protein n=1 Tax=Microbacterium phage Hendrix TaxID=2182341 RepID=A0A2U8UU83_9CAUD|nr:hypothetical protein HOT31_gp094 [Microbacterium phage Hendrix]AWN07765.1 hypothetical protein PBI_HENDRIX_94 [Microbacterium phage Hendrix]
MTTSYYSQYLGAEWLRKHLEAAGFEVTALELNRSRWTERETLDKLVENGNLDYGFSFHVDAKIQIGYRAEDVDKAANTVFESVPGARVFRKQGGIHLYGMLPGIHDLRWHLYVGQGTCERVIVGSRKVMKADPAKVAQIPMIEVDEPIYEIICSDPAVEAASLRAAQPESELEDVF